MGRKATGINRENCTLEEFERPLSCTRSQEDYRRLEAVWFLYRGYERKEIQVLLKLPGRTLRRWVNQFNTRGLDGLVTLPRSGRPRLMSSEEFSERTSALLDSGEHISVVKLHGFLKEELACELSYSTVLRYMHGEGYSLKVPRRSHPDQDPDARKKFLEQLHHLLSEDNTEFWFGDEVGIDGDPRTGRSWFKKGARPKVAYDGCHLRQSAVGAVQPRTGELCALVVPYTDSSVFQLFLDELAEITANRDKNVILVIDNASWHHSGFLNWYHIKPMYLPPYSPDLNPIERLWLVLKERYFKNYYTRDPDVLLERVSDVLSAFMNEPKEIISICRIHA